MTTKELVESAQNLVSVLDHNNQLLEAMNEWASARTDVEKRLQVLLDKRPNTAEANQADADLRQAIARSTSSLKKPKPFVIRDALRSLDVAIRRFYGDDLAPGGELLQELADFEEQYQQFIVDQTITNAFNLLEISERLLTQIRVQHRAASALVRQLRSEADVPTDQRLSLFLPSDIQLTAFLGKIEALRDIYNQLAEALGISTDEHPFRILRVEVGSVWLEATGHPLVVRLASTVLKKGLDFVSNFFAKRNRTYKDEPEFARLKDALTIASELKKLQPEKSAADCEQISAVVARRLLKLLDGEDRIELNGETYVIATGQPQLHQPASPKHLQDKSES